MKKHLLFIVVLFHFFLGCTTALCQNHNQVIPAKLVGLSNTHSDAKVANNLEEPTKLEVLVLDLEEEISSNETAPSSFTNKSALPSNGQNYHWHSFINNTSSQEVIVGSSHYLVPFIGFSTPIYLTQRVIRI